jgi:hypothetical protein
MLVMRPVPASRQLTESNLLTGFDVTRKDLVLAVTRMKNSRNGSGLDDLSAEQTADLILQKLGPVTFARRNAENRWNEAIDWLLNSRHTGDPDIQKAFWGVVDGKITRDQADRL